MSESGSSKAKANFNMKKLILHIEPNRILLELKSAHSKVHRLSLDRNSGQLRECSGESASPAAKVMQFTALLGLLEVKEHRLLVLAKEVRLRCTLQQNDVFSVESVQFIDVEHKADQSANNSQLKLVLDELEGILLRGMYLSFTLDLTLPYIDQKAATRNSFNWAEHMQTPFLRFDPCWRVPLVQGFVGRIVIFVQGQQLTMGLISRRSVRMGGTRFRARGISPSGYVANYAQTQQIVLYGKYLFHCLQIRGSIPLYWRQQGFSKQIKLFEKRQKNKEAFEGYVKAAVKSFENVLMVNLLSEKKGERKLLESLEYSINSLPPELKDRYLYAHYDVHLQCKGSAYYLANAFIQEHLGKLIEFYGFTCKEIDGDKDKLLNRQRGVVRTNCLDCLDRTNLFQSKIGAYVLLNQLRQLGVNLLNNKTRKYKQRLDFFEDLDNPLVVLFRRLWVYNGDHISFQYAGTTSTHSAVNLEGKQTIYTMLKHGETSLFRKYREYSLDDWKQNALVTLVGGTNLCGERRKAEDEAEGEVDEDEEAEVLADINKDYLG